MANIVSLDETRRHLRYPVSDTQDDASLQVYIDAADEAIERETGISVPKEYTEYYDGGDKSIYLQNKPVLEVINIEEGWGWANYELDYVQSNTPPSFVSMYAYSIDVPETGKISRRTAGNVNIRFFPGTDNIRVIYVAGRSPIPPVIKLAELELIAHWWTNSQQRAASAATSSSFDVVNQDFPRAGPAAGIVPTNQGVPYRILEMIKKYRSEPIIG